MKLLLDECMPRRFKRDLVGHEVATVEEAGFKGLKNGILLKMAAAQFDVLVTVDQKMVRQHNVKEFNISVIVLIALSNSYYDLQPMLPKITAALRSITPGQVVEISGRH